MNNLDEKLFRAELKCMVLRIANELCTDPLYTKENAAQELMEMLTFLCLD
ncbi:hypothetical protein SAMN05192534_12413 [Alteribacillus persepolensis]|uniref:Uncharacterized protein n=1 Tax=Alteribacillus persepolensis TaxID=568899 RepID=A0A1G8IG62_9BACI|nr:hypothetical protein [Alteribacillus persepolensis]SDI18029.1 hypothetical protein SAMN05192534_12413 [Alteribacillus persepolensis]